MTMDHPNPLKRRIHGALLRWLYRITAPKHPRGWLDLFAIFEESPPPPTMWVYCQGMERWDLPNLEMVQVPADLGGYAHGILFEILSYIRAQKRVEADENMGGCFVGEDQLVMHQCSFRRSVRLKQGQEKELLQIVDIGESLDAGFPRKLFAAHLHSLAMKSRNPYRQIEMLQRAVEIYPGEERVDLVDEDAGPENPGNFFSWELLGNAFCDTGNETEGMAALETAAKKWPFGAWRTAITICDALDKGGIDVTTEDPRAKFWRRIRDEGRHFDKTSG